MTRYIHSDSGQYITIGTTKTLHTGSGKILAIIATNTSSTPASLTLYDNTAASGTVLAVFSISYLTPLIIILPQNTPITFTTGLTAVTGATILAFIITEA